MARYLGPACKIARRVGGVDLMTKTRPLDDKCKADTPPGMHGAKRGRLGDYGEGMRQKKILRYMYGVLERQFRKYYEEAARQKGSTGIVLLQRLESRLDNVVYRMGFAVTRAEARQLVRHGAVLVNKHRTTIPSYQVKAGDVVEIREKSKSQLRIKAAIEMYQQRPSIDWVDVDSTGLQGTFKRLPEREELPTDFNEQLVVELYSK
jgi:small subunit ribosomal protein S4